MKKWLLLTIVLLSARTLAAQQQQQNSSYPRLWTMNLTVSNQIGPDPLNYIDLRGTGVTSIGFAWHTTGTVSAGACAAQGGADASTFGTTVIAAQTVTSSGGPTAITAVTDRFVRLNCTTAIVGSGSVDLVLMGWTTGTSGALGSGLAQEDTLDTAVTHLAAIETAVEDTTPVAIAGDVAHDTADSGNPLKMGAKALALSSNPTGVTANDRANLITTRASQLFTIGGHPNSVTLSAQIQDADGAQTDAAIVTVSSGTKIVVTRLTASCDGSTTNPTNIKVGFGTATLAASAHTGVATILHEFDGIPAGGGFTIGDGGGIIGIGADDADLRITTEDPAGGNCTVSVSYFTIEG